jgi:hypothetical protein
MSEKLHFENDRRMPIAVIGSLVEEIDSDFDTVQDYYGAS